MTLVGKKLYYFVPEVRGEAVPVIRSDYVIAEEFDITDRTLKVRFLNGKAVQKFAVGETEEEVKAAIEKFEEYRIVYNECFNEMTPIENRLKAKYEELYGDVMDMALGDEIERRHNPDLMVPEEKAEEPAGE